MCTQERLGFKRRSFNIGSSVLGLLVLLLAVVWWITPEHLDPPTPQVSGDSEQPGRIEVDASSSPSTDASVVSVVSPTDLPSHPGSISGTARYADTGAPVAGIAVRLENPFDHSEKSLDTDEAGEYRFTDLAAPSGGVDLHLTVHANQPGYRAVMAGPLPRFFATQAYEGVDITVIPNTASVSGTVYTRESVWHPERIRSVLPDLMNRDSLERCRTEVKTPLAGVTLELRPLSDESGAAEWGTIVSDQSGRYTFSSLAPGVRYQVHAQPPADAVQYQRIQSNVVVLEDGEQRDGIDLIIDADDVSVTGRVMNEAGEGISSATVTAVRVWSDETGYSESSEWERNKPPEVTHTAVTDREGRYLLDGLLPLDFMATGGFLTSGRTNTYAGYYVVRAQAAGFAPAQVAVPPVQEKLAAFWRPFHREMQALATLEGEEIPPMLDRGFPFASGNLIEEIDIVLEPAAIVSGRLIDTAGAALPDQRIRLSLAEPQLTMDVAFQRETRAPDWVVTGTEGVFLFDAVPTGAYFFEVDAGMGEQLARNAVIHISKGDVINGIEVVVESSDARGGVAGMVRSAATGSPLEEFYLRVLEVNSPGEPNPRSGNLLESESLGSFRIESISAGTATLEVGADGYGRQVIEVDIKPGETVELSPRLEKEGILSGYVRRNGRPSGGYVTCTTWRDHGSPDPNGHYEVKALAAGRYLVQYTMWLYEDPRGGAQAVCYRWVQIASGKTTRMDVNYDGTAVVQGEFDGPPGSGQWFVRLLDPAAPAEESLRASTWKFQGNGRYEIVDVPAGTYEVVATCETAEGVMVESSDIVAVRDGEIMTQSFAFQ